MALAYAMAAALLSTAPIVVSAMPSGHACVNPGAETYCQMGASIADRVADLVSRLNVTEKLGLLGSAPKTDTCSTLDEGVQRLGIPPMQYLIECNSGVSSQCYTPIPGDPYSGACATVFPSSLNLGATFNRTLWVAKGSVVGDEARALNNLNVARRVGPQYLVSLFCYGPNINTVVDPRYGRNGEIVSEDPYLTGEYAAGVVRGMQGPPTDRYIKVSSHLKHYTAYNVETNRMAFNGNISQYDLWDTYMPGYSSGFAAGSVGAMCSYASINGIPSCGSPYLLNDVVRKYWNRPDAMFTSDCDAVGNMATANHYAKNTSDAAVIALAATMEVNDGTEYAGGALLAALNDGRARIADVDAALSRMLMIRFKLGYFDQLDAQPYTSYGVEKLNAPFARAVNEEAALQSFVLLKNSVLARTGKPSLPLSLTTIKTIAIVGPHADYARGLGGDFYGDWLCPGGEDDFSCISTISQAVSSVAGGSINILTAPGVKITGNDASGIPSALAVVGLADTVLLCIGSDNANVEHEGVDRPGLGLSGLQSNFSLQVLAAAAKVNANVVVILINAGAVSIDALIAPSAAIVEALYPVFGAPQLARTLFGIENRWGRMPFTVYPEAYGGQIALANMAVSAPPGRTYKYYDSSKALFRFGDGLSYSTFSPLACSGGGSGPGPVPPANYTFPIGCTVTNAAASPAGDEILLVYHRVGADVRRSVGSTHPIPSSALVDFSRVSVDKGASAGVSFTLGALSLSIVDEKGASVIYPGTHYFDVSPRPPAANYTVTVIWTTPAPVVLAQPPMVPSA